MPQDEDNQKAQAPKAPATRPKTAAKVPNLLHDWKRATLEACARDFARKELRPELILPVGGHGEEEGRAPR